ncbi:MAG: class I SAM-dependent methyltransferase [Myxococcales bacterium]|nr:class I SAM-dependent methyltransferase [Myxococcales bacterium]
MGRTSARSAAARARALSGRRAATLLVELGCGIGTVATYLNRHGFSVDYSEAFEQGLRLAEARAHRALGDRAKERRFFQADLTRPLAPLGQTGALLLDVIEHLPDDLSALCHVHDALPEGPRSFVVVAVPAFQFLWSPWDDLEKHKRRYTPRSLQTLLERAGFRVERQTFFFFPLFFAALGVKGLRFAQSRIRRKNEAENITDMIEVQSGTTPLVNRVLSTVLSAERPLLDRGSIPLGTSLLAIARKSGAR